MTISNLSFPTSATALSYVCLGGIMVGLFGGWGPRLGSVHMILGPATAWSGTMPMASSATTAAKSSFIQLASAVVIGLNPRDRPGGGILSKVRDHRFVGR